VDASKVEDRGIESSLGREVLAALAVRKATASQGKVRNENVHDAIGAFRSLNGGCVPFDAGSGTGNAPEWDVETALVRRAAAR